MHSEESSGLLLYHKDIPLNKYAESLGKGHNKFNLLLVNLENDKVFRHSPLVIMRSNNALICMFFFFLFFYFWYLAH